MSNPNENPAPQTPAGPPQAGEDVFDAISAVESQLGALKKAATERRQRDSELLARETALSEREADFETRVAQIERDLAVIEQARDALAAEKTEVEAQQQRRRNELSERENKVQQAMSKLESLRAEAQERSGKLESRAQELERAEARLTDQANELGQRVRAMEAQARGAGEQLQAAVTRAESAEHERDDAKERQEEAEQAVRILEASLAKAQEDAQIAFASAGESESAINRLTAQAEQLNERAATLRGQLESGKAELESARAECDRVEREAVGRAGAFDEKFAAAEARAVSAETDLGVQRERVEQLESRARELGEQLEQARAQGGQELSEIESREAELRSHIEQRDHAIAERDRVIGGLQSKLVTATEKITQFGEFIKTQVPGGEGKPSAALARSAAEVESLQNRVAELQDRAESLRAERDRLARQKAGSLSGATPPDAFLELRRERLGRMRKQLRLQSRKVRRANELLQDRFSQCEGLLSRRAELAAAHETLREQRSKTVGRRAMSSAAGAMLAFVIMIGVLVGLSWIAAEKVHPGVYAASAIISADGGDRVLSESSRTEWQKYHEVLFEDPRFIETLADMFKKRGIASLGTPAAAQEAINAGFTLESPSDGQLQLEYRGQGSTRTQRVLDTIAVGVARTANRTRSRRTDGAMSVVSKPAEVGVNPIQGDRMVYAAGIFGGGFCLSLTFGAIVWRRMARAKSTFEHDQQLQALLSEARWQDPRIDLDSGEQAPGEEAQNDARTRKRRRKAG